MTRFADRLDQFVRWFFDSSPTTVTTRAAFGLRGAPLARANPAPGATGRYDSKVES